MRQVPSLTKFHMWKKTENRCLFSVCPFKRHGLTWKRQEEIVQELVLKGLKLDSQFRPTLPVVQFSSVASSCLTLCSPPDGSMPGFPVHHQLLELAQTHVHWVGDAIQPSHPLLSPSPPTFNLSHHQSLFQWVSSSHQVARVLEFQLQH